MGRSSSHKRVTKGENELSGQGLIWARRASGAWRPRGRCLRRDEDVLNPPGFELLKKCWASPSIGRNGVYHSSNKQSIRLKVQLIIGEEQQAIDKGKCPHYRLTLARSSENVIFHHSFCTIGSILQRLESDVHSVTLRWGRNESTSFPLLWRLTRYDELTRHSGFILALMCRKSLPYGCLGWRCREETKLLLLKSNVIRADFYLVHHLSM